MGWLDAVLGREEHRAPIPIKQFRNPPNTFPLGQTVLVTGADGSIGAAIADKIDKLNLAGRVVRTDISTLDVRDWPVVMGQMRMLNPDYVFHLAGAKHAPQGERDPWDVTHTNIIGTLSVLNAAQSIGAKVIMASTCKACDPETAYGASKLVAERMTLNMGGSVARYYNVVESSGNVFEIWRNAKESEPLAYTRCIRRFITLQEAVHLTIYAAIKEPGRYAVANTVPRSMQDIVAALYPLRDTYEIKPRRGDRFAEPEMAYCEHAELVGGSVNRITSPHDPPTERN